MNRKRSIVAWTLSCWVIAQVFGQEEEILDLSLEELMSLEVTSVSKKSQRLQDVPSSIQVITTEDIDHSGAVTVVELLRELVPGFWAATIDFNKYDSYLRNSGTASYLVMLDGTPLNDLITSNMLWDNLEIPLTAIDRIEVVRGSAGVIYGANSATGVISIFTKTGADGGSWLVNTDVALPLHSGTNLVFNKKLNEAFSFGAYGRFRYFSGYEQMPEIENEASLVPSSYNEGDTLVANRFTEDDKTVHMYAVGLNLQWKANERLQVSARLHINSTDQSIYNQIYPPENSRLFLTDDLNIAVEGRDQITLVDDSKTRFTGHFRGDYSLSDDHQLFLRISANQELYHSNLFGGVNSENSITDFEFQDNVKIGFNNLSIGANYRLLNYKLPEIFDEGSVNYIGRDNTESITGFFVQDNIELLDDKLNFYLGAKAENFSLINDDYYFSPMIKVTGRISDKLTLWGGFSRSFTIPPYQQTNIVVNFLRVPSPAGFADLLPSLAADIVIDQAGIPASEVPAFLATPEAQTAIANTIPGLETFTALTWPSFFNTGITNGQNTEPTSFSNFELGFRWQVTDALFIESNVYHTMVRDDIFNSPVVLDTIASPTAFGERMETAYYGNYVDGSNTGLEMMVKYQLMKALYLEFSYALFNNEREYKTNDDFDITLDTVQNSPLTDEEFPRVPRNVFRGRIKYTAPAGIHVTVSGLYSTAFYNKFGTVNPSYQFDQQRFWPLFGDVGSSMEQGRNDDRMILNFKIDKAINEQFSVYAFGNDMLSSPFVESTSVLTLVYPRQTGRMVGLGLKLEL